MKRLCKEYRKSRTRCLPELLNKKRKYIIGLNSGTSADGIDAALVRIDGDGHRSRIEFILGKKFRFPNQLSHMIRRYAQPEFDSASRWLELNLVLADRFSQAASEIAQSAAELGCKVDLIGSHGQTIRHLPRKGTSTITVQLADPSRIAVTTGIPVVGDFRIADIAAGGQGAPITPIANALLFGNIAEKIAILNIGGIANITVIENNKGKIKIQGCDCGPGNMVIDYFARKLFGRNFDKDGRIAAAGNSDYEIIELILRHRFFAIKGPRSAGREIFGDSFCARFESLCRGKRLSRHDIVATAAGLTATAVARTVELNRWRFDKLILTGGGAHNEYLVSQLGNLIPARLAFVDDYGYPSDFLEAISFAVLANEAIAGNRYDLANVTGASRPVVLGKICLA